MAGGSGTRFWPLSRLSRPKQFLEITGNGSLLQRTWERALGIVGDPERILLVTTTEYADLTREQLPELSPDNLLLEPQARNTAPCVAWAAAELRRRDPEAVMAVLPADHAIRGGSFRRAVAAAAEVARRHDALVTFGIPPRYPETGYGYIETGARLEAFPGEASGGDDGGEIVARRVVSFREKPDRETAERYLEAGNFFWNSGIFVWTVERIRRSFGRHLPAAWGGAEAMLAAGSRRDREEAYSTMPATSIDFGIMERAEGVACVRAPFDWSDLGSWAALAETGDPDADGNVVEGRVVALDASDNLVHAPGELVALLGVEGLAVVRSGDVLLVADLPRSQEVKQLRERLQELGLDRYL